jgi:folate-dependent phosphoribosylglycinamide formyltransferase PurN
MSKTKAVIIATEGLTTNLLFESLQSQFDISKVIIENKISRSVVIRRRMKKIGLLKTFGQIQFLLFVLPFIRADGRIKEILKENNLTGRPIPEDKIHRIENINAVENLAELLEDAQVIFINGTRIISKKILDQTELPVVNIHVGITPKYRGVHGGYWALYYRDAEFFGTTLHYVDSGIDTGGVICQKIVKPAPEDNFKSYPILQYCAGLEAIRENFESIVSGERKTRPPLVKESRLHYHPGFVQYLAGRIFRGIK